MRLFICGVIFFCTITIYGQTDDFAVRVQHYQRKLTVADFPLPGNNMIPNDWGIQIPDSLYSQSQIEVKKSKVLHDGSRLLKNAYLIVLSKDKTIYQVNVAIHPKFVKDFESFLKENYKFQSQNDSLFLENKNQRVNIAKRAYKRQVNYSFTLQKE